VKPPLPRHGTTRRGLKTTPIFEGWLQGVAGVPRRRASGERYGGMSLKTPSPPRPPAPTPSARNRHLFFQPCTNFRPADFSAPRRPPLATPAAAVRGTCRQPLGPPLSQILSKSTRCLKNGVENREWFKIFAHECM